MNTGKSLSMADVLRSLPTPLFTSIDAAKLVSDDNMFLFRASKKGYVRKIANRVYWNVLFHADPPKTEQVACFVRQPSYVSCEWALNYHGILLQVPFACTTVTLHPGTGRRNRIVYGEYIIEYSSIAEHLYIPGEIINTGDALLATAEKALLDAAYLRHRIPFADELERESLDRGKLLRLALLYPKTVQARIKNILH